MLVAKFLLRENKWRIKKEPKAPQTVEKALDESLGL
ncbi:MAG: hypothetical protein ACI81C_003970 [Alteromonas macleodii]|jgi:hypothetical protein